MITINEREKTYITLKGHLVEDFLEYYQEHLEENELEHTEEEFYSSFELICKYIKEDDEWFWSEEHSKITDDMLKESYITK